MGVDKYKFDGGKVELNKLPTNSKDDNVDKADILEKTEKNLVKMADLQDRLYAEGRESVLVVLQAMDAAGKDSTIKHVMTGLNPQGVRVVSFKQPTSEELAHDYLWRANAALPKRGMIGIFNRSYYEDVLVVKVHQMQKDYAMDERIVQDDKFFEKRYRQLCDYEQYLSENSYRVVKIFLHVSKETQKKRFLERIDDPAKNWKFSTSDLKERAYWDDYMAAYTDAIRHTATKASPWYVLPADQKWYTRYLVSEVVLKTLEACKPQYPTLPPDAAANLAACKEALLSEDA